ncbi:hypothetical protein D187_007229 [Cystobacter fuscus DSM 2262]|uniref:Uncharacterized protein n=1 Tax=Cystobacter fuscus (strain ATCC 25194 / DSM 2262 / NBRC 100088 / M29) TaxID=1242864 RepID=S9NX49_CYSF2|nr:hypothetical protein D187_007229 [Cystobacter fuscus DSM 2262]
MASAKSPRAMAANIRVRSVSGIWRMAWETHPAAPFVGDA